MSKCKLLHIVATGRLSGAEKVVSDICTNLSDNFIPIIVCAGEELKKYYEEKGLKVYLADINKLNPFEIKKLREIIILEDIQLVHGHDVKASIAAQIACYGLNKPVISHIHVNYTWMKTNKIMKNIDEYFRKKYAVSIACSEIVKQYYLENNKTVDKNKVVYLDNAFNFNEFNKIKIGQPNKIKDSLNIAQDEFVYGYLGRLIEIKGVDLLIKSFYNITKKNANVKLVIVGDGNERNKLESLVADLDIVDKVIFAGYQKNVYDFMSIFDCFILPSVREGLPIAILEAMAMKKTVISTPVAGVVKLIKNGYNGIMLENRNEKELTEALLMILNNEEKRLLLAENAYKHLREKYDINNYTKELEKIYFKYNI